MMEGVVTAAAVRLVCLVFNGTFRTNRLYCAIEVRSISHRAGAIPKYHAIKQKKEYNKPRQSNTLRPGLYGDDPLATVRLPQRSLSSQSLGK